MKFFSKESFWITGSNVAKLMFGLLIVPVISRYVNPADLGKLDLLMAFGPFVNQFISMGLTNSSAKFFKEYQLYSIIKFMQHKIFKRALIACSVFCLGFIFIGAEKFHLATIIIILFSFSLFLENVTLLGVNQFLNENKFKQYSLITTFGTLIRQSFTLLLVVFMADKLLALTLGLLVSNIYLVIINYYYSQLIFNKYVENELDEDIINQIKKYSLPLFVLGIVGLLYQSSDRLLVAQFSNGGMEQLGYLGMAQRIIGVITIALSGLFTVWGVKSFENYSDKILIKEKEKLISLMLVVLVVIIIVLYIFKPLIINYILTNSYKEAFPISVLLIATFVNNRIREILEKYFLRKGDSKLVTTVFTSFSLLSIIVSGFILFFSSLENMLIFRMIVSLLHALVLGVLLRINKQNINPLLFLTNILLSILVIIIMKFKWM